MTIPYAFQLEDIRRLHQMGGRALLAWPMGCGKTLAALLYAQRHLEQRPIVVVCPAGLKLQWRKEAKRHIGMHADILEGLNPSKMLTPRDPKLVIVNYDILSQSKHGSGWTEWLKELKPQLVILDEAHYLGDLRTKRTKSVRKLCKDVPHVLALSGTPLTNRPAELFPVLNILRPDLFPSWWQFGHRYCLPPEAPILMADLKEKPISEVKIGDKVVGWTKTDPSKHRKLIKAKVLDVITKEAPLQKVTLQDGTELICTPDHRWHNGGSRAGGELEYQIAREGRLGGRGRGTASRIMKVFRGVKPQFPESEDYQLGYIHGFFRGDGHCCRDRILRVHPFKNSKKWMRDDYHIGCACMDEEPITRLDNYLTKMNIVHRKHYRSDDLHAITRMSRKECYDFLTKGSVRENDEWWAGFLGGIYDAEGSGTSIAQYQKVNPVTHQMIKTGLTKFGFKIREEPEAIHINGGRKEFLRFWNIANPTLERKLRKMIYSKGGKFGGGVSENCHSSAARSSPFVTKIEPIEGTHTTYTLTTTTGNYVAYGCGSKNCGARRTPWGWDFKGATRLEELHSLLEESLMIRRRKEDVLDQLPSKRRHVVTLPLSNRKEYDDAHSDFVKWLFKNRPDKVGSAAKAEALVRGGYLKRLAGKLKLPHVMDWVDGFLQEDEGKLIVFAHHVEVVEELHARWARESVMVNGSVSMKNRRMAEDEFLNSKKKRLFIGNIKAAGVGWSARGVSTVAFAEMGWTPGEHQQAGDRTHGIGRGVEGQSSEEWWLIAKDTIEERLVKLLQKKSRVLDSVLDGKQSNDFDVFTQLTKSLLRESNNESR